MDLSKLSTADLQALRDQNLSAVSTEGLNAIREHQADNPPDAPVAKDEPTTWQNMKTGASNTMGALGKLAGALRAGTTGPLTAAAIQAATGKQVAPDGSASDALNPTNLKQYPSNAEMFKKAGIKNPQLSDVVPGYAKPGSAHPWYQPEKGGMLDPSAAGVLQVATDPANYVAIGEAKAAAEGLPMLAKGLGLVNDVTNPISMVTKGVGKSMYESPLLPLEQQAARKGKENVAQTLYEHGVKTPANLPEKAQGIVDQLMTKRDALLDQAGAAGGRASMQEAVAPLRARIAAIRATQDPLQQPIADKMEQKLESYLAVERGTPGVPATAPKTTTVTSPIVDESGMPYTRDVVTPGEPAIPGTPGKAVTPAEASGYKTSIYKTQPKTHYNTAGQSDAESELDDLLAQGQLKASQSAVGNSLGEKAEAQVADLNQKAGGLLSTQGAQQKISDTAGRQKDAMWPPTPLDYMAATAGAVGGGATGHTIEGALGAVLLKKFGSAVNQSKMPMGYYARKVGASTALDRLNQVLQSQPPKKGK